jgi:hypothetical protein
MITFLQVFEQEGYEKMGIALDLRKRGNFE